MTAPRLALELALTLRHDGHGGGADHLADTAGLAAWPPERTAPLPGSPQAAAPAWRATTNGERKATVGQRKDTVGQMHGERDLRVLLRSMRPELHEGRYVFTTVPGAAPEGAAPVVTIAEPEGLTLVVRQEDA